MWTEYTRETPARRFLAPAGSAIALAAAVALAWVVCSARNAPTVGSLQSLPSWPIVFSLPQGLTWSRSNQSADGASPDGMSGTVAFLGRKAGSDASLIIVGFQVLPAGAALDEAVLEMTGQELRNGRPARLGPLDGVMIEYSPRRGTRCLAAVACSDRGLALTVQYLIPQGRSGGESIFQSVCRSIDYKRWLIRPRSVFFLPFAATATTAASAIGADGEER